MASGQSSDIKVILCTIAYRDRLLDYVLDVAAALGGAGVEGGGRAPHISEQCDETRGHAVRRMTEQRGLTTPVLGSYLRFGTTNERIEDKIELPDALHTARCLGTPLVRVWASDVGSAKAKETVWKATIQDIQEACEQAAKLGITFVAEMHGGTLTDTAPTAQRLAEEVDCDNFRLNYQVATHTEKETPLERMQMVLPYIAHMHAQNYRTMTSEGEIERVALSGGAIDYAPLVRQLKKIGYNGCIAVEFSWAEGDEKRGALAADLAYLQSLIQGG